MEKLDVEYCRDCDDIYAVSAEVWLCFGNFDGETVDADDDVAICPRCYRPVRRYEGYLEALKKRESYEFIEETLSEVDDLSSKSLTVLRDFLSHFTVPSFAVVLKGDEQELVAELVKKRYVAITVVNNGERSVISLNAYKLRLLDNIPLLERMSNQASFITNPEYLRDVSQSGIRRKARMDALINDFTSDDRAELIERFGGKCALTGKEVELHVDHVIPIAVGHGGTTKANMLPIWQRINSSKSDRNIFEWYAENGDRFDVCPERFEAAIAYLADLNGMTVEEYRDYVYDCHANPNDILTKECV